jgi:hypothetical protein
MVFYRVPPFAGLVAFICKHQGLQAVTLHSMDGSNAGAQLRCHHLTRPVSGNPPLRLPSTLAACQASAQLSRCQSCPG